MNEDGKQIPMRVYVRRHGQWEYLVTRSGWDATHVMSKLIKGKMLRVGDTRFLVMVDDAKGLPVVVEMRLSWEPHEVAVKD